MQNKNTVKTSIIFDIQFTLWLYRFIYFMFIYLFIYLFIFILFLKWKMSNVPGEYFDITMADRHLKGNSTNFTH